MIHEILIGGAVSLAQSIFGAGRPAGTGKVTRADWNEIRRLEAETALLERQRAAMMPGPAVAAPFALGTMTARPAAVAGVGLARLQGGPRPIPTMERGIPGSGIALMSRYGADAEELKHIISQIGNGTLTTDDMIRMAMRKGKITFKEFKDMVVDEGVMFAIWGAMGGTWVEAESIPYRVWILDKINDAFAHRPRRRGRAVGPRVMKRAVRQAAKLCEDLKKLTKGIK